LLQESYKSYKAHTRSSHGSSKSGDRLGVTSESSEVELEAKNPRFWEKIRQVMSWGSNAGGLEIQESLGGELGSLLGWRFGSALGRALKWELDSFLGSRLGDAILALKTAGRWTGSSALYLTGDLGPRWARVGFAHGLCVSWWGRMLWLDHTRVMNGSEWF
jgi:hypothetical protein